MISGRIRTRRRPLPTDPSTSGQSRRCTRSGNHKRPSPAIPFIKSAAAERWTGVSGMTNSSVDSVRALSALASAEGLDRAIDLVRGRRVQARGQSGGRQPGMMAARRALIEPMTPPRDFCLRTRVVFGDDALAQVGDLAHELSFTRTL